MLNSTGPRGRLRRDFTKVRHFPGTRGNYFDLALRIAEFIQNLPVPVFATLLLALAAMPALAQRSWLVLGVMWLFLLGDWALLAGLPRTGRSYGPAKPPTLLLALARLPFALLPVWLALVLQAIGTALVVWSFWVEPGRLGLTRQRLVTRKLPPGRPLRVLHLGDLHSEIGWTVREEQVVAIAATTQPDLILFSGDFLNLSYLHDPRAQAVARRVLAQLNAPLGVLAVSGSPAVDLPEVVPLVLDGLDNIRWLQDELVLIEHQGCLIQVAGLTCTHVPHIDGPRLAALLGDSARERFTLLLYHTPDLAPEAAEAGVDLQLSGHTHGGQVRLPLYGALYAGSLYGKRYEMGRIHEDGLTLYVTRGIGLEGKGAPRVRFLSPPEVVLWEIVGE